MPAPFNVIEVSTSIYHPAPGTPHMASEEATCRKWSLDKQQVASLFQLSTKLREGQLHDYDWLPCSIKGQAQAEGKLWEFEINAAATSIWRSSDETRLMGCAQAACAPLVILMMPGRKGD